jgi:hypothetical protein
MRAALYATAAMNILGSVTFVPHFSGLRARFELPESHPLYLLIIGTWVLAFGLCYLWMAVSSRRDRIFVAIGAVGKLSFFALLALFAARGDLPLAAVGAGSGDLLFGLIFIFWLIRTRGE